MAFNYKTRLGTVSNLPTGATHDLLMITYENSFPEGQIKFDIAETPRKVTGIQKVAQTYMKLLMTTKGSNVIYPTQGTRFTELVINANRLSDDAVLYSELNEQLVDAENQTKTVLNTVGSDSASQLARATVLGIDVIKDVLVMYIKIVTNAGEAASVSIPFPQLDMSLSDQQA